MTSLLLARSLVPTGPFNFCGRVHGDGVLAAALLASMQSAWQMAYTSASKTFLIEPKWKRHPAHPLGISYTHAAPAFPLSSQEPSVQMVSLCVLEHAAWSAPSLLSTITWPGGG